MGFASAYLEKQKDFTESISEKVSEEIKFIIIIPCFNEPNITETLESLWKCQRPKSNVEVIVIINSGINASTEVINQNKKTYSELINWTENNPSPFIQLFVILKENIISKNEGAGYARKLGMDEAIYRFNKNNKEDGVIISLDADTTCKPNYLIEIEQAFTQKPLTNALTIYFEHPIYGVDFESSVYFAITQYELYLRYYRRALIYSGFPYHYYTIGSCFAVTAKAYIKQGGMSRKQAGEDFYFLQKIFSLGNIEELNSTCVYPSPRPSDRVPFGTGPFIQTAIKEPNQPLLTYNIESFTNLKNLFKIIDQLYRISSSDLNEYFYQLPLPVADFLSQNDFFDAVREINANSSNVKAFKKRFFEWFNAFRIIKYLNFVHEKLYEKKELLDECEILFTLFKIKEIPIKKDYQTYLEFLRKTERNF